jgi:hypothetical protein
MGKPETPTEPLRSPPPVGWMIGVMVQVDEEPAPLLRYFAVGKPDQQRAEWAAVDMAVTLGAVAVSPIRGQEPVKAIAPLSAMIARSNGLGPGQVRSLGLRWPRRWIAVS